MTPERKPEPQLRLIGLGEMAPGEHRFAALQIAVGSGGDNDFVIAHPTVSRKHALIRREGSGYRIEDLGSTNGTFVNRRRIQQPVRIQPGDEIGFGATRFALGRGFGEAAPVPPRRSLAKMVAPVAGIIVFAIVGFVAARYLFNPRGSTLTRPLVEPPQSTVSVPHGSETNAPVVESSSEESASSEPAASEAENNEAPLWLQRLNEVRTSAGLAPVSSDPKLSDGDRAHALYLVKNFASEIRTRGLGAQAHTEDVHLPGYTPQGAEAARNSDESEHVWSGNQHVDPQLSAIDGWMTTPFHRLFILSPLLRNVGFGSDCEDHLCVAVLDILSGADPMPRSPTPLEHPTFFPPDGGAIPAGMRTLENEWPTPISGCDGYAFPVGIALTVQLGPMVDAQLDSFRLTGEDGAELEACGFDANSYRNPSEDDRTRVVGGLRSQGAVVIVPRQPLDPGARYDVLATVNGRDYKWSFAVAR